MQICKEKHKSLALINDNFITDATFKKLCENCFAALTKKPEVHNLTGLYNSKPDVLKESYVALLAVTAEFARHDYDKSQAAAALMEDFKFSNQKVDFYSILYQSNKDKLQEELRLIGTCLPHVFDAQWKIESVIKSNGLVEGEGPRFQISLSTEEFDVETKSKCGKTVSFFCDTQQLRDLVYKLRDAVKHCERIANEH